MSDPTGLPWTRTSNSLWSIASREGRALYWEWPRGPSESIAEDFIIFLRTVFPNGGCFAQEHCNHSIIWSCIEEDSYGVGIRKLNSGNVWIVAVLHHAEAFPGSSFCPDRELSLKSHIFLAEEFLRGTEALDILKCSDHICRDSTLWWTYLEKLERVVNWKLPEVKIFKAKGYGVADVGKTSRPNGRAISTTRDDRSHKQAWGEERDRNNWGDYWNKTTVQVDETRKARVSRSRSPTERLRAPKHVNDPESVVVDVGPPKTFKKHRCNRCNVEFEHGYELMRHHNSLEHQQAVAREFPI
jgi:hypothetical protein